MAELSLEATVESLPRVLDFVNGILEPYGCSMRTQMQIEVAVEELYVNIAHYAYQPGTGPALIRAEVREGPPTAVITFIDHGVPYDPLAKEDPDVTLAAEDRKIGGLGIYMVKKSMDRMYYEHTDGQNILTIEKAL